MKLQNILFGVLGIVGFASAIWVPGTGKVTINPKTRLMQDQHGRSVMMHGVNIVPKTYPFIPTNDSFDPVFSLTDAEIDGLAMWGFNVVRLGVMWEAVETAPGVYNDTYLDEMNELINKLGSRGIYSLVDAHQDAVSNFTCGEGYPTFYTNPAKDKCEGGFIPWLVSELGACYSIKDYKYRTNADGLPYVEDCRNRAFWEYYMTAESLDFLEKLYSPTTIQDLFVAFWKKVAFRFAGNPYVVGYDPINEPFPSNVFKDPSLVFWPGKFD